MAKTESTVITYLSCGECPPSWTQYWIGKKHAYVIPALSSSDDFSSRLNVYASGSA